MENSLAVLGSLLFLFITLLTVTTATATATTIESAEREVIAAAEEWDAAALEILDICYPISQNLDEQSLLICDNAIAGMQYFCEFQRIEQLTIDNTPSCNDPRIDSYLDARNKLSY
jgi:hypothetical protein